jgi:hypothetical protein
LNLNLYYNLEPISGEMSLITDPERHIPNNRFNDGKCDPAGRLWAGTMAEDAKGTSGSLYVMEKDQRVNRVLTGIDEFDYDVKTGAISKRRAVVEVTEEMGPYHRQSAWKNRCACCQGFMLHLWRGRSG